MKKITGIFVILALSILICAQSFAGYLVLNATVVSVSNSSNNVEAFSILTSGSTGGSCSAANTHITFFPVSAGSIEIYNRAYKQAMMALATGMKIHVYNYSGDNCNGASYIQLMK